MNLEFYFSTFCYFCKWTRNELKVLHWRNVINSVFYESDMCNDTSNNPIYTSPTECYVECFCQVATCHNSHRNLRNITLLTKALDEELIDTKIQLMEWITTYVSVWWMRLVISDLTKYLNSVGPSWEASNRSNSQEIHRHSWKLNIYIRVHKSAHLDHTLSLSVS
jgi:hypothetical protein